MAKLIFRYGAMNAGKSALLLQVAYNYEEKGRKVNLIKPSIDTKGEDFVVSRIGLKRKVDIRLAREQSLLSKENMLSLKNRDAILVDEAQFLTRRQVEELWAISKEFDIPAICYGLRGDFKTESFEGSKRLLELADELSEMVTICGCGKKARFNARLQNGKYVLMGKSVVIDGSEDVTTYEPLCGKCYYEKALKKILF